MHAIVVVADSLHLGFLGCYGNETVRTPNLDRFAHEAFVFDQCFPEQPILGNWLASSLTGRCQFVESPDNVTTPLGECLRQREVATAHFTDNPQLPAPARWLADFDTHERIEEPELPAEQWASLQELCEQLGARWPAEMNPQRESWARRWQQQLGRQRLPQAPEPAIVRLLASAARWLETHRERPSLAWIDIGLQAAPWLPPAEFLQQYLEEEVVVAIADPMPSLIGDVLDEEDLPELRAAYAGRISYFDTLLGAFLDQLRDCRLMDETLIVLTSEQGMPLGEHAAIGPCRSWLYEERTHVPLLVRLPGGRMAARSPALVQSVDLSATLGEHFGVVDVPGERSVSWMGKSLLPLIQGEPVKLRDYACSGLNDAEYGIRTHGWHLILPMGSDSGEEPRDRQLYLKPEDRWEVNDQAAQCPDVADRLELQLRRHLDALRRDCVDRIFPLDLARLYSN